MSEVVQLWMLQAELCRRMCLNPGWRLRASSTSQSAYIKNVCGFLFFWGGGGLLSELSIQLYFNSVLETRVVSSSLKLKPGSSFLHMLPLLQAWPKFRFIHTGCGVRLYGKNGEKNYRPVWYVQTYL